MVSAFTIWASFMPWITISSETSLAPASTITTASRVPATIRSSALSCCSWNVGLATSLPSMKPMRVAEMGPPKGMSEMERAADAPMIARCCGSCSWSAESVVMMTWRSERIPLGKRGRRGRSVSRMVRMASWVGLPSRRKKLPGIRPTAYSRSSKSMVRGKKSIPSLGDPATAVTSNIVSP